MFTPTNIAELQVLDMLEVQNAMRIIHPIYRFANQQQQQQE